MSDREFGQPPDNPCRCSGPGFAARLSHSDPRRPADHLVRVCGCSSHSFYSSRWRSRRWR
jgi:hypothetical protein